MNSYDEEVLWTPAALNLRQWTKHLVKLGDQYPAEEALQRALDNNMWEEWRVRAASEDFPLSDEWRELLTQLAGPHGYTILRAYQAKHGIKP